MTRIFLVFVFSLALLTGCNKADQERAKARADEAAQKARIEANKLDSEVAGSLKGTSTSEAGAKLHHAGQVARVEAAEAGRKLDHATIIAQVKAKLAADVGLSTVSRVTVDSNGSTVVLTGTVATPDQKRLAEQAASQVSGVTRVENRIQVQP